MSFGVRTISKSLSRVCFISTAVIESIPTSDRLECMLMIFMSRIPESPLSLGACKDLPGFVKACRKPRNSLECFYMSREIYLILRKIPRSF